PEVFEIVQQRFAREAAVLEAVGKGNSQVPDLYAYFEEGGQFYLVQEWMEGEPLVNLVNEDWPEERVRELMTHALKALAHVHQQNIIHRDIKPDNIIVRSSDNLPCLIDFGAVKELMSTVVRQSGGAQSSLVIGTPGFMPPEQAAGRPTFSSDLYSLGMTMIFLLTKRSPAELPTNSHTGEVLWQQFAPEVKDRLATVLSRAVHPYTQNRYPTATDMLAALPPNTVEQTMSTFEQAPISGSQVPTFVDPAIASATAHKVSPPWKRIGVAAGGLLLAAGVLFGVVPKISSDGPVPAAEVESLQDSRKELERTLEENPEDTASSVDLAEVYREIGEYDQAIAQADTVLEQDSENVEALLAKGKVQVAVGEYQEAIETFSQAIEVDDQVSQAFVERAIAYSEVGEYETSTADLRTALQLDPNNAQAYREWAYNNISLGNPQEALQNLDISIEKDDTSISAFVNRGNRKSELGDRVGAAADWNTARKMTATTADEFSSRGYAKSRLGNKKGAIDDYNQGLIVNPKHVRSIVNRAYDFYESGEKGQALETVAKALEINPNSTTGLMLQGELNAYNNPADWEAAIASYSKALAVNPNESAILNNRCSAYYATQQLDLALTDCDRGLQIDPRSGALYVGRGNIRLAQENYEGAIQDFSRTIEIGDENGGDPRRQTVAYSNRASARVQLQDLNGALSDIDKALELKPDDPTNLYQRGLIKVTLNDKAGGYEDMQKSADIYAKEGRTESYKTVLATMEEVKAIQGATDEADAQRDATENPAP
ncbi:MAG: tetratricopeptide repeat protein, partial [Cyanobacteria bacterium J06598_1]